VRRRLTLASLGAFVLMLVAVVAAVGLGIWQYDAWQTRRSAEAVDLTRNDPVPLDDVVGADDPFPGDRVGQPVTWSGTWLPDSTVLVSGREHEGREGYWVVTPLTTGGATDPAVPVVRGWTASRDDVPAAPTGEGEVEGWLQPPEGDGSVDDDPTDDVYPQLRVADLAQRVDGDLYSAYAVATPDQVDPAAAGVTGLETADLEQLPPAGRFTALRNLLYALEWWIFAVFAFYIWWRYVRDEDEAADGQDGQDGQPATPDPVASRP